MEFIIALGIGVIVGSVLTNVYFFSKRAIGTLKIDHSNPNKDVYRLEIDNIDDIPKKKEVLLKVDNNARFSQE